MCNDLLFGTDSSGRVFLFHIEAICKGPMTFVLRPLPHCCVTVVNVIIYSDCNKYQNGIDRDSVDTIKMCMYCAHID